MNIIQIKPSPFKKAVVSLPGIKSHTPSYNQEQNLWKVYRRLTETRVFSGHKCPGKVTGVETKGALAPTLKIPGKDGLKCMCYEHLMRLIKEKARVTPPKLYRSTANLPPVDDKNWEKKSMTSFRVNQEAQIPLSTIVVRWQLRKYIPGYDIYLLRSLFSEFGKIQEIRIQSPNSCIVIFEELKSACDAISRKYIGDPMNKIHCSWWHKSMANKAAYCGRRGIRIVTDPFIT